MSNFWFLPVFRSSIMKYQLGCFATSLKGFWSSVGSIKLLNKSIDNNRFFIVAIAKSQRRYIDFCTSWRRNPSYLSIITTTGDVEIWEVSWKRGINKSKWEPCIGIKKPSVLMLIKNNSIFTFAPFYHWVAPSPSLKRENLWFGAGGWVFLLVKIIISDWHVKRAKALFQNKKGGSQGRQVD